jgi:hypothetical protein
MFTSSLKHCGQVQFNNWESFCTAKYGCTDITSTNMKFWMLHLFPKTRKPVQCVEIRWKRLICCLRQSATHSTHINELRFWLHSRAVSRWRTECRAKWEDGPVGCNKSQDIPKETNIPVTNACGTDMTSLDLDHSGLMKVARLKRHTVRRQLTAAALKTKRDAETMAVAKSAYFVTRTWVGTAVPYSETWYLRGAGGTSPISIPISCLNCSNWNSRCRRSSRWVLTHWCQFF